MLSIVPATVTNMAVICDSVPVIPGVRCWPQRIGITTGAHLDATVRGVKTDNATSMAAAVWMDAIVKTAAAVLTGAAVSMVNTAKMVAAESQPATDVAIVPTAAAIRDAAIKMMTSRRSPMHRRLQNVCGADDVCRTHSVR